MKISKIPMYIECAINGRNVRIDYESKSALYRATGTSAAKLKTCFLLGMDVTSSILATGDIYYLVEEIKKVTKGTGLRKKAILDLIGACRETRHELLMARPKVIYMIQNLDLEEAYKIGQSRNFAARLKNFRTFSEKGVIEIAKEIVDARLSDKDVRMFLLANGFAEQIFRADGTVSEFVHWVDPDDYSTFEDAIKTLLMQLKMADRQDRVAAIVEGSPAK